MAVYKFAGFWRRLIAFTIDCVIINLIFISLLIIVLVAFFAGVLSSDSRAWINDMLNPKTLSLSFIAVSGFYLVLNIFYFTYFHGLNGRTLGKMLLNLQVLSVEGTPINFGVAFLRSVGYLISSIFYLGFIWAAFDRRKQGWHDKIAQTVVIIRPDENNAAGLTVADTPPPPTRTVGGEKQNEAADQRATEPVIPTDQDNTANTDQHGTIDQKIP